MPDLWYNTPNSCTHWMALRMAKHSKTACFIIRLETWAKQWKNKANDWRFFTTAWHPLYFPLILAAPSYVCPRSLSIERENLGSTSETMLAIAWPSVADVSYRPRNVSCAFKSESTCRKQIDSCSTPLISCVPSTITEKNSFFITSAANFRKTAWQYIFITSSWAWGELNVVVLSMQLWSSGSSSILSRNNWLKFPSSSSWPRKASPWRSKNFAVVNIFIKHRRALACCFSLAAESCAVMGRCSLVLIW